MNCPLVAVTPFAYAAFLKALSCISISAASVFAALSSNPFPFEASSYAADTCTQPACACELRMSQSMTSCLHNPPTEEATCVT